MLADYKPVFATIPKAFDDSRSSRGSAAAGAGDHYRDYKPAPLSSSYGSYFDVAPRHDGISCTVLRRNRSMCVISLHSRAGAGYVTGQMPFLVAPLVGRACPLVVTLIG